MRYPLPHSKIKNQQPVRRSLGEGGSFFINPIVLDWQIVLVQFNSMGDPENGGRFTVKKYHSGKTVSEDAWQHNCIELLPLNPDYDPIPVASHESPERLGSQGD